MPEKKYLRLPFDWRRDNEAKCFLCNFVRRYTRAQKNRQGFQFQRQIWRKIKRAIVLWENLYRLGRFIFVRKKLCFVRLTSRATLLRHRPRTAIKLPTHKSSKVLKQEIKPPSIFSIKTRLQSVGGCKVWVKNKTLLKGHRQRIIGRVFNGPAQKSSKYGTGPTKESLSTPCQVVPGAI